MSHCIGKYKEADILRPTKFHTAPISEVRDYQESSDNTSWVQKCKKKKKKNVLLTIIFVPQQLNGEVMKPLGPNVSNLHLLCAIITAEG